MQVVRRVPNWLGLSPVVLRPWTMEDLAALVAIYSDPQSVRWIDVPQPYGRDEARAFVSRTACSSEVTTARHFAVTDEASRAVVGAAYLHDIDTESLTTEISWLTHPAYRGVGIATSAAVALSTAALDAGFQQVLARISIENAASARIAERAGFQLRHRGDGDELWDRSRSPGTQS